MNVSFFLIHPVVPHKINRATFQLHIEQHVEDVPSSHLLLLTYFYIAPSSTHAEQKVLSNRVSNKVERTTHEY